jgi:hypothetical protein
MNHVPFAVDIGDFEKKSFLEPETAGVDGLQIGIIMKGSNVGEDFSYFFSGKDSGKPPFPFGFSEFEGVPFPLQDIDKEEFDAGVADPHGCRTPLKDFLAMDKILDKFFFRDFIRSFVIKFGKLSHGTDIGFLGPFTHAGNLEGLDHFFMPDSFKPPILVLHDSLLF